MVWPFSNKGGIFEYFLFFIRPSNIENFFLAEISKLFIVALPVL